MTNYRVFDGHCDTPIELWLQNQPLRENTLAVSLARAQRLGTWAQFFAFCTAWVKAKLPRPEIFSRARMRTSSRYAAQQVRPKLPCRLDNALRFSPLRAQRLCARTKGFWNTHMNPACG